MGDVLQVQAGSREPIVLPVTVADITGWSARATLRRSARGPVLHEWSTDDDTAEVHADRVELLTDGSEEWVWRSGTFDLRLTQPGTDYPLVRGPWFVKLLPLFTR